MGSAQSAKRERSGCYPSEVRTWGKIENKNRGLLDLSKVGKVTRGKKPLAGLKRVRKLSEVLAETRERQKGRPLKSQEEVTAILRKG